MQEKIVRKKNLFIGHKLLWKLSLPFLLFVFLLSAGFISTIMLNEGQKKDALILNLIGRQRLLTQMMTKGTLMLHYRNETKASERLITYSTVFNSVQKALWHGGDAIVNIKTFQKERINKINNDQIEHQFQKINELWLPFHSHLLDYLNTRNTEDIEYIIANNMRLYETIETIVILFQKETEKKVFITLVTQILLLLLSIIILTLIIFLSTKKNYFTNNAGGSFFLDTCKWKR